VTKATIGNSNKCKMRWNFKVPFLQVHFHFFSNACQSQSGTIVDVVFKCFRRVITKICFKRSIKKHVNSWEEVIHRRTDWNFPIYSKFRFISILIIIDVKINNWKYLFVNPHSKPPAPLTQELAIEREKNPQFVFRIKNKATTHDISAVAFPSRSNGSFWEFKVIWLSG
jgi:hypothetical protein